MDYSLLIARFESAGNDAFVKKLTLFLATGRSNAFSDLQSHLFSHVSPDCRTQNIHDDIRELRSPRRQIDLKHSMARSDQRSHAPRVIENVRVSGNLSFVGIFYIFIFPNSDMIKVQALAHLAFFLLLSIIKMLSIITGGPNDTAKVNSHVSDSTAYDWRCLSS